MGEVFAGRYELVDPIGRGGVGAVWRAWDHRRRRYVAAKVLQQRDAHSLLRFVREQALRIDHPHVLAPASWAADDDKVLFTMDLVAGGSLVHLVGDYGPLPPAFVCTLLDQLLSGLAAVHAEGVVHRDIKPANILMEATGTARPRLRLSDFGIAMRLGEPRLTETDYVVGTPGYLAPEQLLGVEPDFPADLFAVGLVALYLLQGAKPDAKALVEYFTANGTPGAPQGVPGPLWEVVATLVQPDPAARFRTAIGARKALAAAVELLPEPGPDVEQVEIFDQLGPLPAGFGPDGPVRSGAGGSAGGVSGDRVSAHRVSADRVSTSWPATGSIPPRPTMAPPTSGAGSVGAGSVGAGSVGAGPGVPGTATPGPPPPAVRPVAAPLVVPPRPTVDPTPSPGPAPSAASEPKSDTAWTAGPTPTAGYTPTARSTPASGSTPTARSTPASGSTPTASSTPASGSTPTAGSPPSSGPMPAPGPTPTVISTPTPGPTPTSEPGPPPRPSAMSDTGSFHLPPPLPSPREAVPVPPQPPARPPSPPAAAVAPAHAPHHTPTRVPSATAPATTPAVAARHPLQAHAVPSPHTPTEPQRAARHGRRAATRRPGPPAKVAVPVLLLALLCYAVGFWALLRI
ncbi:serine/threonine-protein kinase [Streptomyces sp. Ru72]|uniref:serine/threonine-protein kinase n=1 Tax=Streptomyces sp. Ru72 TaxID=2080747 RepID=UPI000CDCF123|nr:serine/threonine-protein kinase [Streptomyces sp. Ru72]POX54955.1 serine/threonine protein kinase [Streptomyces sp. Ru72]